MPVINHHQVADFLAQPSGGRKSAAYLIHGHQVLVEQCLHALIDHLLGGASKAVNCEVMDGLAENVADALEHLNTYALLGGPKILVFKDAKLFEAGAAADDALATLEQAIEKGFPAGHALVITVHAKVPGNRKLYKAIQSVGTVVDCHVPAGERRADKSAQEAVLRRMLETALQKAGKRTYPGLFAGLYQLTGFDPATFRDNIEKLIDYCGRRTEITAADLSAVIRRTKSDPLFELTNAVADRNLAAALFFVDALLAADWHPLQLVSALANQIRKLLVARDFSDSEHGRSWNPGMGFPQFQQRVLPAIQAYDTQIAEQVRGAVHAASIPADADKRSGKDKGVSELALASNPANAYPVFQTLVKSGNYQRTELMDALEWLSEADLRLKSTGQDGAMVIRTAVMTICAGRRSGSSLRTPYGAVGGSNVQ